MKKMDKKWVILCSTAIAAVYTAGFVTTESQANINQPNQHEENSFQTNSSTLNNSAGSIKANSLYQDGIYTGTGMNRRGSIEVQVTINNDKITDVEISDFAMHYSESDVVGLPDEVLQNQSAEVQNVSGATYSTEAFHDAIQDALDQAQNVEG
ncbi:FMN-binding domain-containing protein [Neobacillus bataviensis LMG 21833]|uniref:FMN-binding domain-containing protein n=1 Tax=Neobacillus bataviensis LMG 21833 TaxID=1117379 RepID=K6C6C7_9BACI|nr:FMN-binding protein [Neobacillus bataviensis]EKN66685.1 FMN-binding domain-containing protein [Neobacillus bataviensis LMG 21833]